MRPLSASNIRGLDPVRLNLGPGSNLTDRLYSALNAKGAKISRQEVVAAIENGLVTIAGSVAFIERPIPDETTIPLNVRYFDDEIVVIDKPAGIATTPQGSFVARSVLVQARRQFDPALVPAHRLDRATYGLIVLVRDPKLRGHYQHQFERREVTKIYHFLSTQQIETTSIANRLVFDGERMVESGGDVNAETTIRPLGTTDGFYLYQAEPITGVRHQIRAHAAMSGAPIFGDTLYAGGQPPDSIALLSAQLQIRSSRGETIRLHSTIDLVKKVSAW